MKKHPNLFSWLAVFLIYFAFFLLIALSCHESGFVIGLCGLIKILLYGLLAICFFFFLFLKLIQFIRSRHQDQEEKTPAQKFHGTLIRAIISTFPLFFLLLFVYTQPALKYATDKFFFYPATKQSESLGRETIKINNFQAEPIIDPQTNKLTFLKASFSLTISQSGKYWVSAPQVGHHYFEVIESPENPLEAKDRQLVSFKSNQTEVFTFWYRPTEYFFSKKEPPQLEAVLWVLSLETKKVPFSPPLPKIVAEEKFIVKLDE